MAWSLGTGVSQTWSALRDLNPQLNVYKTFALPVELRADINVFGWSVQKESNFRIQLYQSCAVNQLGYGRTIRSMFRQTGTLINLDSFQITENSKVEFGGDRGNQTLHRLLAKHPRHSWNMCPHENCSRAETFYHTINYFYLLIFSSILSCMSLLYTFKYYTILN